MIGIISDTHDNVVNVQKAVKLFTEKQVDFVIHMGDVVAPATVKFFDGVKMKFVKGNCDGDIVMETERILEIGGEYLGELAEFEVEGKKIAAIHGNNSSKLGELIKSNKYDYVFHGHTHKTRDERVGSTRVLNPGAHYFGGENTVVLLDLKRDTAEFVKLK